MIRIALGAALCVLIGGCGGGSGTTESEAPPSKTTTVVETVAAPSDPATQVQLWFTSGEQFKTVDRALPDPGSTVVPTVKALLAGPTPDERAGKIKLRSQIPAGVKLEKLSVSGDGTAVVSLSPNFLSGVPPESAKRGLAQKQSLNARLGQVTYTVTQFDDIEAAKVVSGGAAVEPDLTRGDYAKPKKPPKPIVKAKGSKQTGTAQIQAKLAKLGYLPKGAIDGLNGYQTQQAVIAFQAWEGLDRDGVVGPVTSAALAKARRPFPTPQPGVPMRRIEVYRDKGVALLIESGRTKRAVHVSAGAGATPTPAGVFKVFRKELRSWSVPFSTWLPYASYFNAGIAFHEYAEVPPFPASHGCVRVPSPDAKRVYSFAKLGTVVVVI